MPEGQRVVDVEQIQRFHAEELRRLQEELKQAERDHLNSLKAIRLARK